MKHLLCFDPQLPLDLIHERVCAIAQADALDLKLRLTDLFHSLTTNSWQASINELR